MSEGAGEPGNAAIRRIEGRLSLDGGRWLFRRSWLASESRRAIAIVHGFGEHSGRYDHVATFLAARGADVHAFDLRGHGRSSGRRGHVDSFADYLDDVERFLEVVRAASEGMPLTLLGHSMGGLITTSLAVEREPEISSLVTSGAALAVSPELSGAKITLARILRHIAPRFAMDAGLDPNAICTDSEVVRRYVEDPLVHGTSTLAHAAAMFDQIDRVAGAGARVSIPVLMLHGTLDRLCPPQGTQRFFESLPGAAGEAAAPAAALQMYERSSHEILNDVEQAAVLADIQSWIEAREPETQPKPE